jgi:hypothetical protein
MRSVTSEGHPRARFQRAIKAGNLVAAEAAAREISDLTLEDALRSSRCTRRSIRSGSRT